MRYVTSHDQEQAIRRLADMMHAYLIQRDAKKTLSYFAEDVHSTGAGACGAALNKEQLRTLVQADIQANPRPLPFSLETVIPQALSEELCSVYAVARVTRALPSVAALPVEMRCSAVLRKTNGVYCIQSLHIFIPSAGRAKPVPWEEKPPFPAKDEIDTQLFTLMNEISPTGILGQYNRPGYPLYWINDQLLSFLGYSYEQLAQRTQGDIFHCVHPDDREILRRTIADSIDQSGRYAATYRMIRKDGSLLWISSRGRKMHASDGQEIIVSVCVDITSQIEMEDELGSISRGSLGGIFKARIDPSFTVLFANDNYFALHGYSREQMQSELGGEAIRLVHPDDLEWILQRLNDAMESGQNSISFEYRVIRRDGKTVWLLMSAGFLETSQGVMLSGMVVDVTQRKEMEEELRWSRERFQIALSKTGINMWEYDIVNRRIFQSKKSQEMYGFGKIVENVPDSLVQSGLIHPDSIQEYLGMYQAIHQGAKTASCVVQRRSPKGRYYWERIQYTTIFDQSGEPIRAVAVSEDVSAQKYAEHRFVQEEELREMLSVDVLLSTKINLSADRVFNLWSKNKHSHDPAHAQPYTELYHTIEEHIANSEDRKRYRELFSQPALLALFRSGERSLSVEFRYVDFSGRIVWTSFHATLLTDPETGDVMMFGYIRDIDKRKKMELALRERAEKDAVTGLYNKPTIESMIRDTLKQNRRPSRQCALLLIDLDNFKQVNDRYGHLYGDKVLKEIGRILHANFQNNSLTGRVGGDEFVVLLEDVQGERQVFRQAEKLCRLLHFSYSAGSEDFDVTCSIGISVSPQQGAEFEAMFQEADSALYHAKKQGKAQYISYKDQTSCPDASEVSPGSCIARQHIGGECMLDQLPQMVFVIDYETHDMLYMNASAKKEFGVSDSEYLGCKCYQLLQGFSQPCVFCQSHPPHEEGFQSWENCNARLHKRFSIQDKMIRWNGRPARLELYSSPSNPDTPVGKNAAYRVLLEAAGFLLSAPSIEDGINGILERMSRFYCADRCYFAQITDPAEDTVSVVSQWPAGDASSGPQQHPHYDGSQWIPHLRKQRVVVYCDIELLRPIFAEKYDEMQLKKVHSFYAVALMQDNQLLGYLGVENPRKHSNATTMLVSISHFLLSEITKRNMQKEHDFLQSHDSLTGCLNWNSCNSYLFRFSNEALSSLSVLVTDVNYLGEINRQYGKEYGDDLIRFVAATLQNEFGSDAVYRLTGDKFVVFQEDVTYATFVEKIGSIRAVLEERHPCRLSFGHTWADQDILPEQMLKHATESLLAERQALHLNQQDSGQDAILQKLKAALAGNRFQIFLQPKAEVSSGQIKGAEALIRYVDEQRGIVPPVKFIPLLEETGLIRYIDFFVLEEVCKTLRRWQDQGLRQFPISLNFSRTTLLEKDVVDHINDITGRYGISRSLVKIEITESMGGLERRILSDIGEAVTRDGYRLSLDDFGAEYSNFSILSALPLSELKIDKSIINDLYSNANTRLIVENLVRTCRQLGIDSVAEGVEQPEQLDVLRAIGCTYAQGYLYNKPLPVEDFERRYIASLLTL